jgi:hypothetical protein
MGPALVVFGAASMEAQPPAVIVGQAVTPTTNAIADRPLVIVDTGAEQEVATILVAAPPGQAPVRTRIGVKPVLNLTGEQLDGEREGG